MTQVVLQNYRMLIDGEWVSALSGEMNPVVNPATSDVIAEVPKGGPEDAKKAVDAARERSV